MRYPAITVVVAVVLATFGLHVARADTGPDLTPADAAGRKPIAWHGCQTGPDDEVGAQLAAVGAQCGEVTVPLDHAKPAGPTLTVAVARRKAIERRIGTLLVNTGGPGESRSGVAWVVQGLPPFIPNGAPEVAARFDVVAVDPRFHGASSPLECGWPTATVERAASVGPDRGTFTESVALNRELASRCTKWAALLPHASTRNVARDLDVVRAALGEREVSFLGWSWGTYLGAVYAQLFPARVGRLVLDSAVNPDTYGPEEHRDRWSVQWAEHLNWASWAGANDGRLGRTTAEVLAAVDAIRRAADEHRTLRIGKDRIDPNLLRRLVLATDTADVYRRWTELMRLFSDAARGIPVTPTPEQEALLAGIESTEVAAGASAFAASRCADRAARSRDPEVYYRDIRSHRVSEPMYGPTNRNVTPCTFWPTEPAEPPTTVRNAVPALIVGAGGDPTTPLSGQLAMHRALTASRMVVLRGAYRHGVYLFDGNACVDGAVNRYLLDGKLPPGGYACTRTSPTT